MRYSKIHDHKHVLSVYNTTWYIVFHLVQCDSSELIVSHHHHINIITKLFPDRPTFVFPIEVTFTEDSPPLYMNGRVR